MMKAKRAIMFRTVFLSLCLIFFSSVLLTYAVKPGGKETVGWKENFNNFSGKITRKIPEGWKLKGKPGTPLATFFIDRDSKNGISFLRMKADSASASLIRWLKGADLKKTPTLRWKWRAVVLPKGADGRRKDKDDQAIGIYVGTGGLLNNKSVSYRWDTDTPKGAEGNCVYGGGAVKVKWFTLRNADDAKSARAFTETRDVAEDFKKAWGFCPKKIYLSIVCNSQYTGTEAVADLDWIELISE